MFRQLLTTTVALPCLAAHAQFAMQNSGTVADLRGIVSVGNGVAWASGTRGTVLRTKDGGTSWQGCAMPAGAENLDFRGIQAFDDRTAIVMSSGKGDLSRIYKTTDGCLSWKLVFTNPDADGFFDSVRAMTRDKLFVLGDPVQGGFALWRSDDGGSRWLRSVSVGLAADAATQGAFAASNSSLVAAGLAFFSFATGGKAGAFLYQGTTTVQIAGLTTGTPSQQSLEIWTRQPVSVFPAEESGGIFSIAPNLRTGDMVAVGGDYRKPDSVEGTAAWYTQKGGMWHPALASPHGYRSSVAYSATTKTWITVGPNGTDISRDDGRNWQPLRPGKDDQPDADRNWNALSLPFVAGPHGRIGRLRGDALGTSSKTSTQGR